MVTGPDVAAISAAVDGFVDALAVVQRPDGRTPGSTARKNGARAAAAGICRQYARLIKHNAGISDVAKIAAGIKPMTIATSQPRTCPVSAPIVTILAATSGAHTLTYADSRELDMRRKPAGADGLLLFRAISTGPVTSIEQAQFYRKYTTKPMPVFFDGADRGKCATYFGRWVGQRGDMGPVSAPVSMPIAA
jgi:hypothetical protein